MIRMNCPRCGRTGLAQDGSNICTRCEKPASLPGGVYERGEIVEGNVLDWKPPRGMREILRELWELMAAKHKAANVGQGAKAGEVIPTPAEPPSDGSVYPGVGET